MSAATVMGAATMQAESAATVRPRQLRRPRPSRGSGRRGGPIGRAATGVGAPTLGATGVDAYLRAEDPQLRTARSVAMAPAIARSSWRLTDRGIALVLITGAVLLAAAVTVITATALTVTSTDYMQPGHSAIAGR